MKKFLSSVIIVMTLVFIVPAGRKLKVDFPTLQHTTKTVIHDRGPVKDSLPNQPPLSTIQTVSVTEWLAFKDDNSFGPKMERQYHNQLTGLSAADGLKEGQMVQVSGYLYLAKLESDGDYHLQISVEPDKISSLGSPLPCLIAEVPDPSAPDVPAKLALVFAAIRQSVRDNCFAGHEPTGALKTPRPVTLVGQLFYDFSHTEGSRGAAWRKQPMKATNLWEIHPVSQLKFTISSRLVPTTPLGAATAAPDFLIYPSNKKSPTSVMYYCLRNTAFAVNPASETFLELNISK